MSEKDVSCHRSFPSSSAEYWNDVLGSPVFILAPMVDGSEAAWRILSRRYKAQLCFTPMLHATVFVKDHTYRKETLFKRSTEDRPLITQFCANDPEALREAAKLAIPYCEGIDLNLGCPQTIAKKGFYGAFLQDDWQLVKSLVKAVADEGIPISCKIRVFPCVEKTVEYAKMLEHAGCKFLTVHGRTREQKGPHTGLADWSKIAAVKEAVKIPVVANGNIQYLEDVERCLQATRADGVMIAEGSLHNPTLFAGSQPPVWEMGEEYLNLMDDYPCPISWVRGHMFKLYHHCMHRHTDLRGIIARADSLEPFKYVTEQLRMKLGDKHRDYLENGGPTPYWVCQPYVRPPPDSTTKRPQPDVERVEDVMSRRKRKRLLKLQHKATKPHVEIITTVPKLPRVLNLCSCQNPASEKCENMSCRRCCMELCRGTGTNCSGHRFKSRLGPPTDPNKSCENDVRT